LAVGATRWAEVGTGLRSRARDRPAPPRTAGPPTGPDVRPGIVRSRPAARRSWCSPPRNAGSSCAWPSRFPRVLGSCEVEVNLAAPQLRRRCSELVNQVVQLRSVDIEVVTRWATFPGKAVQRPAGIP